MTVRRLDPELQRILDAIAGGGMFDAGLSFADMRARFETAEAMCRHLAREAGAIVVSVGFRLAPEHPFPASLDDCFAAVRWTAAHAAELPADARRIAVAGDASGATYATVCTMLARDAGGPPLAFQLLLGPCTEFADKYRSRVAFADDPLIPASAIDALMDAYAPAGIDRTDWRLSPVRRPDVSGLPPAYVLAAEYDFLRDEELAYVDRLRDAGVTVECRCWPGTVHNFFSMHDHLAVAREAMREASAALRRALHGE